MLALLLVPASSAPEPPHRVGFSPARWWMPHLTALDPVEIYADGFGDLRGIAVDGQGSVFVADRARGSVTRIAPDGTRTRVASGLDRPVGLAFDPLGRLLIAEERAGRVVRLEPSGRPTVLVSRIKQPRWLATLPDGMLFISARRLTRDTDPEPDDESAEPEVILQLTPTGQLRVFADGFKHLQGLVATPTVLYAATQGRRGARRVDGVVFQVPILADGTAGAPQPLGRADEVSRPVGLARDRLGALYLTTREVDLHEDDARRAVAKLHPSGAVTLYAERLAHPQGLAFDAGGNLYVADGSSGRVLRFRSPPAPAVTVPAVTNQSPVEVTGATLPGARVDLFVNDVPSPVTVMADATGAIAASIALTSNATTTLEVFAMSRGGRGLTSRGAEVAIVHDGLAPTLGFQAPPAGAHVRGDVGVQAQAADAGTGIQSLALTVDGQTLAAVIAPPLPAPSATATATWTTTGLTDGAHTLGVVATDQAGNTATTTRVVLVDNTPPDTQITGGPTGQIPATDVTFTFTGTDNPTPVDTLRFAWRLDGGAWSEFQTATTANFTALTPGPHTFEVKARDLAGNEDPTPAQASFTVGAGVQVRIMSPTDGATVSAGPLLVRGTVDAGGAEVGVSVNGLPAAVQEGVFLVQVPVTPTTTTLLAVATTPTGASGSQTIALAVSPPTRDDLVLSVVPSSGVAPLTVAFSLSGAPAGTLELDADGDGVVDFTGDTLEGQVFTYLRPGLYLPAVTVTDAGGARQTIRALVQVFDLTVLDGALQAKWTALREALRRSDVDATVSLFALSSREAYRDQLTALAGVGALLQVGNDLGTLRLVQVRQGAVTYDLRSARNGVEYSFHVLFVVDEDGVWRLWAF